MTRHLRALGGRFHRGLLRGALRALAPATTEVSTGSVRRVLISGGMGIGNAVMFEPLLNALRERFPGVHLAVVAGEDAPSLPLFRWPGLVDEVITVSASSRLARALAGLRLARRRWDLCLVRFNGATQEIVAAAVFGRVPYRVGHVSSGRYSSALDWLFNLPVTMGDWDHEVDRYLALAERVGCVPNRRAPMLPVAPVDRAAAESVLGRLGVARRRPLVALQPGTSAHQRWKRWPAAHWRALIHGLDEAGCAVIALGSAGERELLADICRDTPAMSAAGLTSLRETAAILERAELLVSTDSALMHVAAAVGTPVVGIFGPTDRTRTRPYGTAHTLLTPAHCRGNTEPCLSVDGQLSPDCTWSTCLPSISPDRVLRAVVERLGSVPC